MIEVIKYVADDGEEFEYEDECREYEWGLTISHAKYSLLSGNFQILAIDNPRSYEDVEYIFLPDEQSANDLYEAWDGNIVDACRPDFLSPYAYASPDIGLWAYDWDNEKWYHIGNHIRAEEKRADACMKAINKR